MHVIWTFLKTIYLNIPTRTITQTFHPVPLNILPQRIPPLLSSCSPICILAIWACWDSYQWEYWDVDCIHLWLVCRVQSFVADCWDQWDVGYAVSRVSVDSEGHGSCQRQSLNTQWHWSRYNQPCIKACTKSYCVGRGDWTIWLLTFMQVTVIIENSSGEWQMVEIGILNCIL